MTCRLLSPVSGPPGAPAHPRPGPALLSAPPPFPPQTKRAGRDPVLPELTTGPGRDPWLQALPSHALLPSRTFPGLVQPGGRGWRVRGSVFQPRLRCPGHPTHWAPHQGTTPSRGPPPRHWVQWKTWGPKPHPPWSTSQDTGDHPSPQGLRFRGGGALTAGPTQSCPAPIPKAPCQEPASWAAWPHTSSLRPPPLNGLPVLHVRPNKTADPGGCRPVQQDASVGGSLVSTRRPGGRGQTRLSAQRSNSGRRHGPRTSVSL